MVDSAEVAYNLVHKQLLDCSKAIEEADRRMALATTNGSEGKRGDSELQHIDS